MIETSTSISPTANVALPHQSILAGRRSPRSCSFQYAQTVPKTPNGTDTRNTSRQLTGASRPPSTRPMNEPAMAATALTPSASPRSWLGNASVRMAEELPITSAPPTPCPMRIAISQSAADEPCIQVTREQDRARS